MAGIDQITTEVIAHRFRAATDEMLAALVKTAYSPNVKERRDCSVAAFDGRGNLISMSAVAPIHLSSLMGMIQNLARRFPLETMRPGDVYLTNDPYVGGGSHLPDLTLTSPVFVDGRMVAFAASLAHHSDIGGKVAGSESADCTSIFQEGLRIPPVKLADQGRLMTDILDIVLLNSRTPRHRDGDIKAQIAANAIGARRIQETFARFGAGVTLAGIDALLDYAEARTRAEIAAMPDGTYENEDFLDHDGVRERLVKLKVAVTIKGDSIHFDFTGSDPQIPGARNMPLVATLAGVYHAVKVVADPALPPNAGYFRAIGVTAPPGTVVNCRSPAACGDRGATVNILGDLLLGALAKAVPERVMAGCGSRQGMVYSGVDPRRREYFVDYEVYAGATGALHDQDGRDAVRVHASVTDNQPIEAIEQEFPLSVGRYELIEDSGGAGRFRGGLGVRLDVAMLGEEPRLAGRGLRQALRAPGLYGGAEGRLAQFVLDPDTPAARKLPSVFSDLPVSTRTTVRLETPSGGGFGDPLLRDPGRVLADVVSGKVSREGAARDYGVVVAGGAVDRAASDALRREFRAARGGAGAPAEGR
ncbi:MAG: hydantoinase B/oxoprolinase family protein [Proteobacteria bacterium]|nr:hydantoinase B/oxoprolinase family protein [Pseudomonadota bacterium]